MIDTIFFNSNGHKALALVAPGVGVMITIFCDFCQISAKQLAFFSKPML
jgi:hypothetical protein